MDSPRADATEKMPIMYVPKNFAMNDRETAAALTEARLAQLVSHGSAGFMVTPLPLLYRPATHTLVGHVSRANPHWQQAGDCVAIFSGPQAYISPSFYATKSETGKVVPTWNYEVVTVYGELTARDDPHWVHTLVTELTARLERGRPMPWGIDDAPREFTAAQIRAVVGVELSIDRIEGKAKMSQNQPERNRIGVIDGLRRSPDPSDHRAADCVETFNTR